MFHKHSIDLDMIDTSSKMNLKMSCLRAADNDVEKARELYAFLVEDIGDMPDFEPEKLSAFDNVKRGASEVFGWIDAHREDIAQGVAFVQSLRVRTASAAASAVTPDAPPIPKL